MYSFLFIIPNWAVEVNVVQREKENQEFDSTPSIHLKATQSKWKLGLWASIYPSTHPCRLDRLKSDLGFEYYLD